MVQLLNLGQPGEALTEDQTTEIQALIKDGEGTQQAILAGLRALADYICIAGESGNRRLESLNDLSWIVRHLSLELEAITEIVNCMYWRSGEAAKAKPATYESGIKKGRKECWEAIHELMEANRQTTGDDRQAEAKGLTLASTAIFEMINSPTQQ